MNILSTIESHLQVKGIAASAFGRCLCNDPRLVFDLRNGRKIGTTLKKRIKNHIADGTKHDRFARKHSKDKV